MKRRVILISTIVVVLAVLGAGIYWYTHRHGASKDLTRADLAIKAGNFDKAAEYAKRYTAKYPDDWRGYHIHARALSGAGRYDDARKPLTEAAKRFPDRIPISLALAGTYSLPARQALSSPATVNSSDLLRKAIGQLEQAQNILDTAHKRVPSDKIADVKDGWMLQERVGLTRVWTGMARKLLGRRLLTEAEVAQAARQDMTDVYRTTKAGAEALLSSRHALEEAMRLLPDVAKADPSREPALGALVDLCTSPDGKATLALLFKLIAAAEDPALTGALVGLCISRNDEAAGKQFHALIAATEDPALIGALGELRASPGDQAIRKQFCKLLAAAEDPVLIRALVELFTPHGNEDELKRARKLVAEAKNPVLVTLVELCIPRNHEDVLKQLREMITAAKDPAPTASTMLVMKDLDALRGKADAKTMAAKQAETARFLDEILSRHPDAVEARLERANLAIDGLDLKKARKHCDKLNPTTNADPRVRLLHARLLGMEGHEDEARRELFSLTVKFPQWVPGQLAYAHAIYRAGSENEARAMDAMRAVVKMSPGHPKALAFLIERLLSRGHYDLACDDASDYYKYHPGAPVAIRLYVRALTRTNRTDQARKILKTTKAKYADKPEVLITVVAAYDSLGNRDEARRLAEQIVKIKPDSSGARIAVARAMTRTGRMADAEALLIESLTRDPGQADVAFYLGMRYAARRQVLDALRQFRQAVKLSPYNMQYRIQLARVHLDNGDCLSCMDVLRNVGRNNWEAEMLRLKASLLLGRDNVEASQTLDRLQQSGRSGHRLAMLYLRSGKLDECIAVCKAELAKNRSDPDAAFLLGRAYLGQGKRDLCIRHWKEIIRTGPDRLPAYQYLALVLGTRDAPEQVAYELSQVPGAQKDLVNLAMGWLEWRRGRYTQAAKWYGLVADSAKALKHHRSFAKLRRSRALALTGQTAPAIGQLDELATQKAWKSLALLDKAIVLLSLRQKDQATKARAYDAIAAAVKHAIDNEDISILRRAASLYVRIGKTDEALDVCKAMRHIMPKSPRPYTLTAAVCSAAGRDDAVSWYRKAVEVQPGGIGVHVDLAKALDAAGQPLAALAALKELEQLSESARVISLFRQGVMFARWGVQAQAVERFERLQKAGYGGNARVRLALGRALAQLGERDKARAILSQIEEHASQYVSAQLLLADLADNAEQRLKALNALAEKQRGEDVVPIRQMSTLLQLDRADEALKVFETAVDKKGASATPSAGAEALAMTAELRLGHDKAAADRAVRMCKQTQSGRWRAIAGLLTVGDRPAVAADLLVDADQSGMANALIGLIVAARQGQAESVKTWYARIRKIDQELKLSPSGRGVPPEYMFLAAVAASEGTHARQALADLEGAGAVMQSIAAEVVSSAGREGSAAEAAELLRASMATEYNLGLQAQTWAMAVLKARPTCQWAAAIVFWRTTDKALYAEVLGTLKPADCLVARMMRASLHMRNHEYDQAAEIYARLAAERKDSTELTMDYARALEMTGRLPEAIKAIKLYRKVWLANSRDIAAANNVAYLMARVHPRDKGKLAEARELILKALKDNPQNPMLLDTAGWVAHLLGDHDTAAGYLHKAVKALPNVPVVHYHLGKAEAAAGRHEVARWHLSAATRIGRTMEAKKQYIAPETADAIDEAQKALGRLP